MPFTRDEFKRVLAACDKYPSVKNPNPLLGSRMKALVLLLRRWVCSHRCRDAYETPIERWNPDFTDCEDRKRVWLPLPAETVSALGEVQKPNGYFFWSGQGTKKSYVGDYQRAFKKLYTLAEVKDGHAHRWRDTFAVELLAR